MTARSAGLMWLVLLVGADAVAAETGPARALVLRVQSTECATSPAFMTLVEALQVELAASGPRCCAVELRSGPPQTGALSLDVDPCDPAAEEVEVSLDGARGRRVSLADVPREARPRALALAVAELVRSAPAPQSAPPPVVEIPPPRSAPWSEALTLEAVLRAQPQLDTLLGGGRLGLALLRNRFGVGLDAEATAGKRTVDLGTVDVRLVRLAANAGPRFPIGRALLEAAASAGLGWAWVEGRASRSDVSAGSGSGLIATLGVRAALEAPTSHRLRVRVSAEGGETLHRLTADVNGAATAGVSGAYFVIGVGLGLFNL